jgi:hypothetical protein
MRSVKPYSAIAIPYPREKKSILNSRLGKLISYLKKRLR